MPSLRHATIVILALLCLGIQPIFAQDEGLLLLTDSVDPDTGMVSLLWVNINEATQRSVTSFNTTSLCEPAVFEAGGKLLYEPFLPGQLPYTFQIDLNSGGILPVDAAQEFQLQCPAINPTESSIAWTSASDVSDKVIITNMDGSNPVTLAEHPSVYDLLWSPDGNILIYTAVGEEETFRLLIAHAEASFSFWQRDAGLVIDYTWLPDGSALLLLYYTQDDAVLGRLDRECVTSAGCQPTPLATFDLDAGLRFTDALSPDGSQVVVAEEGYNPAGGLSSDLYLVNTANGEKLRLTDSPSLVKTSAIWHQESIYFTGATLDPNTFTVSESAIYRLSAQGGAPEIAYQAEGFYPIQIYWHSGIP